MTCATIAWTDSFEVTSALMPMALPPMAAAVWLAVVSFTSVTTTVAPSAASFCAMPRPMPWPAPVTIAILLSSFPMCFTLSGLLCVTANWRRDGDVLLRCEGV
jgi:hypothetical protein